MIRVVFLGKLADLAGRPDHEVACSSEGMNWSGLLAHLQGELNPVLAQAVDDNRTKLALNGAVLADKTTLHAAEGDEVALLPPVSGG